MSMFKSQTLSQTLFCARFITVLLCCFSTLTVQGAPITTSSVFKLDKQVVEVDLNTLANFTCTLSCDFSNSHSIEWLFGTNIGPFRSVSNLIVWNMIDARIISVESCRRGDSADIKILSVNATSLDLDKSPVQCFGAPKTSAYKEIYTEYSVLRVNDPSPVPPTPAGCQQTTQQGETEQTDEEPASSSPEGSNPDPQRMTSAEAHETTCSGSILSPVLLLTLLGLIAQYLCS